jgi:hypothetical protein
MIQQCHASSTRRTTFKSTLARSASLIPIVLLGLQTTNADPPESRADVRCFIAAVSLLQSPNNLNRAAAASTALYYLGRLDGRQPGVDLERIISDESQKLKPEELRSESERCGRELSARAQVISAMGGKLSK